MDEFNLRVFLMVTHSHAGTLPLAIIITSDETTRTLIQTFELLKASLPDGAFFGNGHVGPSVIMTDNCSELREALSKVWPKSILLLCIFHLLQQVSWQHVYGNYSKPDQNLTETFFKKSPGYCEVYIYISFCSDKFL